MRVIAVVAVLLVVVLAGCGQEQEETPQAQPATVPQAQPEPTPPASDTEEPELMRDGIVTEDHLNIAFDDHFASGPPVILLHELGADRSVWDSLEKKLQDQGYATLSIDLRGHGESTGDYTSFNSADYSEMVRDVAAAKAYLVENRQKVRKLVLIGSSLGANVALNYAATDRDVKQIVMLSPGLDYRGVETEEAATKTQAAMFISASTEDIYAFESSLKLKDLTRADFVQFKNAGHGTVMFKTTNLEDRIVTWLNSKTA